MFFIGNESHKFVLELSQHGIKNFKLTAAVSLIHCHINDKPLCPFCWQFIKILIEKVFDTHTHMEKITPWSFDKIEPKIRQRGKFSIFNQLFAFRIKISRTQMCRSPSSRTSGWMIDSEKVLITAINLFLGWICYVHTHRDLLTQFSAID